MDFGKLHTTWNIAWVATVNVLDSQETMISLAYATTFQGINVAASLQMYMI